MLGILDLTLSRQWWVIVVQQEHRSLEAIRLGAPSVAYLRLDRGSCRIVRQTIRKYWKGAFGEDGGWPFVTTRRTNVDLRTSPPGLRNRHTHSFALAYRCLGLIILVGLTF